MGRARTFFRQLSAEYKGMVFSFFKASAFRLHAARGLGKKSSKIRDNLSRSHL